MKRRLALLTALVLTLCTLSCRTSRKDIAHETFSLEQAKIEQLVNEIYQTAQRKDFERLVSYHLYGPKFTEFKNAEPRHDSIEGAKREREGLLAVSDFKYELRDLKVNVFGEAAVVTFHGYFSGKTAQGDFSTQAQSTMVFVKSGKEWKIAHEHFSPLKSDTLEK